MSYFYEHEYVSVQDRKKKALKLIAKLRKKDKNINPVSVAGKIKIARSFWGQAWCRNIESYRDLDYRLERGRSYLRHGAVVDLKISKRKVRSRVSGSSLYQVEVDFDKISKPSWNRFAQKCVGEISSVIDLLSGKIPETVSKLITDKKYGLFPKSNEIKFSCNCPDYADVCKHIAATLYGIGVLFDDDPGLFFVLRNVNPKSLIEKATQDLSEKTAESSSQEEMENLFGIEICDLKS